VSEKYLVGLDDEQREAASAIRGPVVIIAGAGTGKTRTITHRIAHAIENGVAEPSHTLALTYTAKAASELRLRLAMLGFSGVQAHTFHSAAWRQLQFFWNEAIGGKPFRIISNKSELINAALNEIGRSKGSASQRDLATEIEWAKGKEIAPEDYARIAQDEVRVAPPGFTHLEISELYRAYDAHKQEQSQLDFEDILLLLVGILEEQTSIIDRVRAQYRTFTVDEYQDISPLQQRLLSLWLGNRKEICVVGDPDQSIFSFAGSTNEYLLGFTKKYPEAQIFRLNQNYRSTSQIVHVANKIADRTLTAVRGKSGQNVRLSSHATEFAENEKIIQRVQELLKSGVNPRDIALLFRRNDQLQVLAEFLTSAGIPINIMGQNHGQRPFFYDGKIKEAIRLIRGASIATESDTSDIPLVDQVRAVLTSVGWISDRASGDDPRFRLLAFVAEFSEKVPGASLRDLINEFDERERSNVEPENNGVVLSSIHSAKGLEWAHVFVPRLREGVLPISYALDSDKLMEEERRLFYVAVTRAKDSLQLSFAGSESSRFLGLLPPLNSDD
jgi:DNA helicase-2/ATP-dependent DNA helicase PcrA